MTRDCPAHERSAPRDSVREFSDTLLAVAGAAIDHGLATDGPPAVDAADYAEPLRAPRATFVTLHGHAGLRGCIGTVDPARPLVEDVAANAYAAAFRDPRFPPLVSHERLELQLSIEILTPFEQLAFASEADLLSRIVPGRDGLLVEAGPYRATFLPVVWDTIPEPAEFWAQLKRKAGIPADMPSTVLEVHRYRTETLT